MVKQAHVIIQMLVPVFCSGLIHLIAPKSVESKRDKINPGMVAKNTQNKEISISQIFLNITAQHSEASFQNHINPVAIE
jgi:hypothetical protein